MVTNSRHMSSMGLQTIQRLRMEDRGTAVIDWRLQVCPSLRVFACASPQTAPRFGSVHCSPPCVTGKALAVWGMQGRILGVLDVDVAIASTFTMNLLTGRVEQHRCAVSAHCAVLCQQPCATCSVDTSCIATWRRRCWSTCMRIPMPTITRLAVSCSCVRAGTSGTWAAAVPRRGRRSPPCGRGGRLGRRRRTCRRTAAACWTGWHRRTTAAWTSRGEPQPASCCVTVFGAIGCGSR